MSNKYWENENAIETKTEYGVVRYFKEAGKVQLYGTYIDKNGDTQLGKGCVWDNNEMSETDAVNLAFAVMQGLLDVGVSNDAFAEAYNLLADELENTKPKKISKSESKVKEPDVSNEILFEDDYLKYYEDGTFEPKVKTRAKKHNEQVEYHINESKECVEHLTELDKLVSTGKYTKQQKTKIKKYINSWDDDEISSVFKQIENEETYLADAITEVLSFISEYEF